MQAEVIDHYRLLRKLGAGGMGEVHKAEDMRLRRRAALKFLPDAVAHDAHALEHFEREARAESPDGRYLVALTQDSRTLMLYHFRTRQWSKWFTERGDVAFPTWSRDGR